MNSIWSVLLVVIGFGAFSVAHPTSFETLAVDVEDAVWIKVPKSYVATIVDSMNGVNIEVQSDVSAEEVETGIASVEHKRNRRSDQQNPLDKPFSVNAEANHSRQSGTNVNADATARLWQSQNQRHEVHGTAQYGQHFGGPYGRSPASVGGGFIYRHRF